MLEVIDKGSATEAHPVPLLFVHGAWHADWCWDEGFLDFFVEKGFRVLVFSLRGHGGSSAPRPLRFISMADYLKDVATVAANLPVPPGQDSSSNFAALSSLRGVPGEWRLSAVA